MLAGLGASIVNAKAKALPSKMEAAKDELIRTLTAMPDGTRFMIVFFDDAISAFAPTHARRGYANSGRRRVRSVFPARG